MESNNPKRLFQKKQPGHIDEQVSPGWAPAESPLRELCGPYEFIAAPRYSSPAEVEAEFGLPPGTLTGYSEAKP